MSKIIEKYHTKNMLKLGKAIIINTALTELLCAFATCITSFLIELSLVLRIWLIIQVVIP